MSGSHSPHTRTLIWLALGAGAAVLLAVAACEHEKNWRGAKGLSKEEIADASDPEKAREMLKARMAPPAPGLSVYGGVEGKKAQEVANEKSAGCISCHTTTDSPSMHAMSSVQISCIDCHGGDATVMTTLADAAGKPMAGRPGKPGTRIEDVAYLAAMQKAHVQPRNPEAWYGKNLNDGGRAFGQHVEEDPATLHGSRIPENTYAALLMESPEFVRFINPGDLRVADYACGSCHGNMSDHAKGVGNHIERVRNSMMTHGAQLWGAATYNNGGVPNKTPRFGESYSAFGLPQRLQGVVMVQPDADAPIWRMPTTDELNKQGVLAYLDPLPTWNITQPGNVLRIFERGQELPNPEIGNPDTKVQSGKPDKQLSTRGLGTLLRVDPVFLGLQKTRLLDPNLSLMGTNDHPGDYRASGCTACHVVYANDRQKHADSEYAKTDKYAEFGNGGRSATSDPTIPKDEPGHPIKHVLTSAIPSSQCVTCHMHPGTSYANAYLGYMWWDNESDGAFMYPDRSKTPTPEQEWMQQRRNPEGASLKGLWGDLYPEEKSHKGETSGSDFLERSGEPAKGDGTTLNDRLEHNQFGDFHGHGWMFRAIFKKDRKGNLLTQDDKVIDPADPHKWKLAVHLKDVHLSKGMQCVDCHFEQDSHGDGKLYGEARNAIQITCVDCHGTYERYATLKGSGPAAHAGTSANLFADFPVGGDKRFKWEEEATGRKLYQYSAIDHSVKWEVVQTLDTINPASTWSLKNPESAELSRYSKTVQKDRGPDGAMKWGDLPVSKDAKGNAAVDHSKLAHSMNEMECYTCHTSWMTSCAGCHLPMKANVRSPMLHNENLYTRNFTQYNYQVLRDDVYQLGRDSAVKAMAAGRDPIRQGGKIVPVRSSSAVIVSSQNAQREWIYSQQQTVSGEGYSGQAFNPHFPHATSAKGTTKMCNDCHLAKENDNNAWMAQLLLQGTNFMNFLGRYVYVATGEDGLEAVVVTEREDPQAVYGSHLHSVAYPDEYKKFVDGGRILHEAYEHGAKGAWEFGDAEILDLQQRGEYLYAARGAKGFYAFDIANIDNKGFSERITTSAVSPLGQHLGFSTSYCVAVASPGTLAVDPARTRMSSDPDKPRANIMEPLEPNHVNLEQPVHPMYAYLYIGDRDEGVIMTNAATLLDGDPENNFLSRAKLEDGTEAFNPNHLLDGLTHLVCAGHYLYVTCRVGMVIVDIDKPLAPKVIATVGSDVLTEPQSVAVQFRYAFVTDREGFKVIDITDPTRPMPVSGATVPLSEAHRVYIARTYACVAAGKQGLAIIDVTSPEHPVLQQSFTADGAINDARDVKVGMTNASLYAYVADGRNGLRVLQLMGPDSTPQFRGFEPPLSPRLIATYPTRGPALAISKGLDRDRAVDESGNQVAVFGRLGARPLHLDEMQQMYMKNGKVWTVTNKPESAAEAFTFKSPDTTPPPAKKEGAEEEGGTRRRRGGGG